MSILTDKDKAIFDKFLREEDNEQALKKMIIESMSVTSVDITPAKIEEMFGSIEDIIEEWREPNSK